EFRTFVRDGRVRATSVYARHGKAAGSDEAGWPASRKEIATATAFANRVVAGVPLPPGIALDVGWLEARGWAVVEANLAWSAALYACDPAEVLLAVARACEVL